MAHGPFVLDEELIETRDAEMVVTARHLEYETGGEVDIAVFAVGGNRQAAAAAVAFAAVAVALALSSKPPASVAFIAAVALLAKLVSTVTNNMIAASVMAGDRYCSP